MLIGELAEKTNLSRDTIRYYEKEGLIVSIERKANNYRIFPKDTVNKIKFIQNLKLLGFTIKEIRKFILLFNDKEISCHIVKERLENHLELINSKIEMLTNIKEKVNEAIAYCHGNPEKKSCQTLAKLLN